MGSVRCNSRSRFDCNLLLSCIYTKVFLLQEISEEDVDPEEVPETNSEHLKLPATKPEPVEKDKTGTGSVQTIGVKKYKKLVQKLVTQGPRKASNATDISVVFFFLIFSIKIKIFLLRRKHKTLLPLLSFIYISITCT